jgi:hypothetical protein
MNRETKRSRLERAGFVHLSGWVPAAYAERVAQQVEMYRDDVARLLEDPVKARGRPKKSQ